MMPAARKPDPNPSAGLATLPRRNGLVIVGGKRPIGILIHEGDQMIQPELALWLDEASGFVFGSDVINPSVMARGFARTGRADHQGTGGSFDSARPPSASARP